MDLRRGGEVNHNLVAVQSMVGVDRLHDGLP